MTEVAWLGFLVELVLLGVFALLLLGRLGANAGELPLLGLERLEIRSERGSRDQCEDADRNALDRARDNREERALPAQKRTDHHQQF